MLGLGHTLRARPSFRDLISKKRNHQRSRSDSTGDSLEEEEEPVSSVPTAQLPGPQDPPPPAPTIEAHQSPSTMAAVSLGTTPRAPADQNPNLVFCLCI